MTSMHDYKDGKVHLCHVTFTYQVTHHSYDIIYDPMLLVDWKNVRNLKKISI